MYDLICPQCGDVRVVSFVRLHATTICPKCRHAFHIGEPQVRRKLAEQDTPTPVRNQPPSPAHDSPPAEPHELLHPPAEQPMQPQDPWHRRIMRRLGLGRPTDEDDSQAIG